jgi:putative redox protein
MVEIKIAYEGDLHCKAVHGPSGTSLQTDAPRDNMGKGETFSPSDLLATSLGTCMMTIMGIAARKHGIDLSGATVNVQKEMIASPVRRVGKLTVNIVIPVDVSPEQRIAMENAAHACPVHRSLHPEIQTPITFEWGGK